MGEKQSRYNPKTNRTEVVHQGADVDEDELGAKLKVGTGREADLGSAAKGKEKSAPMPKQADYPDNASYAEALRKWRGSPETSPQKAAIVKKLKGQ